MINAIIVQVEELQELVESAVSKALNKAVPQATKGGDNSSRESAFLNTTEACKYLHCSKPYLHKLKEEGKLVAYRLGLHNLYKRSELEAYVHSVAQQGDGREGV